MISVLNAEPDPNFHIYLCFGQSNMEGNATVPDNEKQVSDRFKMMYTGNGCNQCGRKKGQWYTAVPPLARCFHWNNGGFGPVDYFGRTLVEKLDENITVGVIVVACGGADIQLFEKDGYESYLRSCASWLRNYANDYGGNPYGRMIDMAKLAQEDGVIKGILLHQGETNNGQQNWPNRVKSIYEGILSDLGLTGQDIPLLVGETRHDGACSMHNSVIAKVPSVIPNSYVVSAEGCQSAGDEFHFSVAGYKLLGQRYAEKMLEALEKSGSLSSDGVNISAFAVVDAEPGVVDMVVSKKGAIQRVEIYADNKLLSNDEEYKWTNVSAGTHTVWALGTQK